jgi:GDP-mannose 6-dehydrogenase
MGRLLRRLGVDARDVMDLFCVDTKLNLSRAYLSPGFAFGGSCLPKDLRSLLYLARVNFLDLPLLSGTLATNELSVREVVDRVLATDAEKIAILGLSFKMHIDDLRESPYVSLAEALLGKGLDVRIYDPIVEPANLVGTNLQAVSSKLPHLRRVLTEDPSVALDGADLALVSTSDPAVMSALAVAPPPIVIDLSGRLGNGVEMLPGYEGAAW